MTETLLTIPLADIEALEQAYTFRGKDEIWQFLAKYPFLVPVLLEAPDKIRNYFPDSQLFLEVDIDAEVIDWMKLVLSICMKLDPDEATKRENQLDKQWWLDQPYEVRSKMFTTLEYPDDF